MTIVVGFVPKPEGRAALRRAAEEARLRATRLIVVNSNKGGGSLSGEEAAQHERELACGFRAVDCRRYRPRGAPTRSGQRAIG